MTLLYACSPPAFSKAVWSVAPSRVASRCSSSLIFSFMPVSRELGLVRDSQCIEKRALSYLRGSA